MRVWDEQTWESEYWDDYLKEFGVEAYVEARYGQAERNRAPER